jgi:hypothetical protein
MNNIIKELFVNKNLYQAKQLVKSRLDELAKQAKDNLYKQKRHIFSSKK